MRIQRSTSVYRGPASTRLTPSRWAATLCGLVFIVMSSCGSPCSDRVLDVSKAINVLDLSIETDKGELLWKLHARGEPLSVISYGAVPPDAHQLFPLRSAEPRRLSVGERVNITIFSADSFYIIHAVGGKSGSLCGTTYETGNRSDLKKHQRSLR